MLVPLKQSTLERHERPSGPLNNEVVLVEVVEGVVVIIETVLVVFSAGMQLNDPSGIFLGLQRHVPL